MEKQLFLLIVFCFGLLLLLDEYVGDKKYLRKFISKLAPEGVFENTVEKSIDPLIPSPPFNIFGGEQTP